jgi:mRNA-degrading endonuclease RelE of RelBE toxin-antitoxin system
MYQPEFHPKVDKDLSKFDKNLRKDIRDKHIPKILEDPYRVGKSLTGRLAGLKSYSFTANRVDYRIIYDIFEEKAAVLFLMVGPRENFYKRLLRRLGR